MKVLFLDIDGVLNRDGTKERTSNNFIGVDRRLSTQFLNWLEGKDIQIVLSSSWRLGQSVFGDIFTGHLKEAGLSWISETPRLPGSRGSEISLWLKEHPEVTHFAILDDHSDMHPVGANLVQTSEKTGLRSKDLVKLEKLLEV